MTLQLELHVSRARGSSIKKEFFIPLPPLEHMDVMMVFDSSTRKTRRGNRIPSAYCVFSKFPECLERIISGLTLFVPAPPVIRNPCIRSFFFSWQKAELICISMKRLGKT